MKIEPATCPACGNAYDPLRAQAVTVIDGRVRAFCSAPCRERGLAPPPKAKQPETDAHEVVTVQRTSSLWGRLPAEQRVLAVAASTALAGFVLLIVLGRHHLTRASSLPESAHASSPGQGHEAASPADEASPAEVWIQPVASAARPVVKRDRRLFFGREGIPENECTPARCSIEIDAPAGTVVMAVHDGVILAVERSPTSAEEGRFVRINHKGGAITSSYLRLDGLRQDLKPGVPVKAGEPIGTVAHSGSPSTRPHFRFAMTIRNGGDGAVLFIDPQPLLALWPARHVASLSLRAMEHAASAAADDEGAAGP